MSAGFEAGPGWAARSGDALTGELSYARDGTKPGRRTWPRSRFDPALTAWFDAAADGDRVEVIVKVRKGQVVEVRMARPPLVITPKPDQVRLDAVARLGGGVNPYTFIPTPPRQGLPPELDNGAPTPHGVIDTDTQWSGWLVLRLVTKTPLLLPDPDPEAVSVDGDKHRTYPVRLGSDGKPLLHGASVKGALRSAYETVTASRYGVFRGHDRALAYRRSASRQDPLELTPARVESDGSGGLVFRICKTLPVPLYDTPPRPGQRPGGPRRKARAVGAASARITRDDGVADWSVLHRSEVGYTTRTIEPRPGQRGQARVVVDTVTLLPSGGGTGPRGWLSITGRSIETKGSERLFVLADRPPIPVGEHHHAGWHSVLASYRDAAEYSEPGLDRHGKRLERSVHVRVDGRPVPERLVEGDLVYLDSAVHPVMIGRLPYPRPPSAGLDESLRPAAERSELSPADRLFGWAPQGSGDGRRSSSGYRGRLRIESVRCETDDWLVDHRPDGVTLAPLGSPKPTQFRFYAAADDSGTPVGRTADGRAISKDKGYTSGLRGRKAYWYPSPAPDGYWEVGAGSARQPAGRFREWQGLDRTSQNSTQLGWVREGSEFTVRIFADAVPGPELGPLLWLAAQEGCALRLGAGKPLGFGAVSVSVDWAATELRTGEALAGCWLALDRPKASPQAQAKALADEFDAVASSNPVLAPAIAAWQKVAGGIDEPIHYPRTQEAPQAEGYRWFVANERVHGGQTEYGLALPHVLEPDQRLPLLPPDANQA